MWARRALLSVLGVCACNVAHGACDGSRVRTDQVDGSFEIRCVEPGAIGAWAENGDYALHRADGSVALRGELRAGAREGRFELLDEQGRVVAEQFYTRGTRSGAWRWFDDDGQVTRVEVHGAATQP